MAAPTFTNINFGSTDQTQKYFWKRVYTGLSGNYTNGTGIPCSFVNAVTSTGTVFLLPATYTGPNGPGQGIPVAGWFYPIGGYSLYFDQVNRSIRIYNGITELATGALPASLTAAGIYSEFEFLRG